MLDLGTLIGYMKLDTSNFDKSSETATGKIDGLGSKLASFGKTAALGAAAGVTALAAGVGVAVKAFSEAETAQKQLEHATLQVAGGTREQLTALEDLSAELEHKGVLDGDNIKTGLAQLQTFGLSSDMVLKLGGSMADLAVNQFGVNASAEDLTSTANMMAKALNGDFGVLEKSGIRFTETQQHMIQFGTETEKATAIQEGFAQNLKFTNEVAAQTTEGGLAKMKVSIGNLTESVGALFAPKVVEITQKITKLADYLSTNFAPIFNNMKENFVKFFSTLDERTGILTLLKEQFNQVVAVIRDYLIPKLVENKDLFISIGKLIGGVLIVIIAALAITIKVAVVAFAAIVGAVLDAYNWFKKLGTAIQESGESVGQAIHGMVDTVVGAVQSVIDAVWKIPQAFSDAFNSAVDKAKSALSNIPVVGGVTSLIPGFASGVENFGGGLAVVGENGAELVNLPRGSSVMPNDQLASALSGGKGGMNLSITVTGNTVNSDKDLARIIVQEVEDHINRRQEKNQLFGTV